MKAPQNRHKDVTFFGRRGGFVAKWSRFCDPLFVVFVLATSAAVASADDCACEALYEGQLPVLSQAAHFFDIRLASLASTRTTPVEEYVEAQRQRSQMWAGISLDCRDWVRRQLSHGIIAPPQAPRRNYFLTLRADNDDPLYDRASALFGTPNIGDDFGNTHAVFLQAGLQVDVSRPLHLYLEGGSHLFTSRLSEADRTIYCDTHPSPIRTRTECIDDTRVQNYVNQNRLGVGVGQQGREGLFWLVYAGVDRFNADQPHGFYLASEQQLGIHRAVGLTPIIDVPRPDLTRTGAYVRAEVGTQGLMLRNAGGQVQVRGLAEVRAELSTLGEAMVGGEVRVGPTFQGRRGRAGLRLESGLRIDLHQDGVETSRSLGGAIFAGPFFLRITNQGYIQGATTGLNNFVHFNLRANGADDTHEGHFDSITSIILGVSRLLPGIR